MSQEDPPGRVRGRPADSGSLQPWKAAGHAPIPDRSVRQVGLLSVRSPPNQEEGNIGGPAQLRRDWILRATRNRREFLLLDTDGRLRPPGSLTPVSDEGVRRW